MDLKRIRELLGEGAYWALLASGFFILIASYTNPRRCCKYCNSMMECTNNIPEIIENNVLTNTVDSVE